MTIASSATSFGKPLKDAAHGKKPTRTPVWLMRQAGRYLPEYREIRSRFNTLTMFKTPKIATEITLQPLERFDLDGAILYADILLIPDALGMGLSFVEKEGPRFLKTIRSAEDFRSLQTQNENLEKVVDSLGYVFETVQNVSSKLSPHVTMLGFAGAPFTVASYMIEGGSAHGEFTETKKLMYTAPDVFHSIMSLLTQVTILYLKKQIEAGVEVIQLFESWSGALSAAQYETFCEPYVAKILRAIEPLVPCILFLGQGAHLLSHAKRLKPQILSVDWRQDLAAAAQFCTQNRMGLQGHLDPLALYAPSDVLKKEIRACVEVGQAHPYGYIFNLGHGITQHTPVENVDFLVKTVHG
jgi:uroporphyrinogen decarboxylase